MKEMIVSAAAKLRIKGMMILAISTLLAPLTLQAVETTSAIRGRVETSSGAPVASASIVVQDLRNGVQRTYETNSVGNFLAAKLPVGGPYKITVNKSKSVVVDSISLGDIYSLAITLGDTRPTEEVIVTASSQDIFDVASGPSATFGTFDMETAVAYNRDIVDVYSLDPRLYADVEDDGFQINCLGKHPRFNSVTLDGVSQNDRFGLNSNGYSTAVGMPFPYDAINQVAVELAPFDVTYGGFSACNINAVTKTGGNDWDGNVFYEYTNDSLRGTSIDGDPADYSTPSFKDDSYGFSVGGPLIEDKLFIFGAYEKSSTPRFLARGYAGSGNGDERPWYSQADHDRITNIATTIYNYDTGGLPGDGIQENEKYMLRLDYNINEDHNLAIIYNYFDGFQDRDSDGDSGEFEYANHFYTKGAESETFTVMLASQWTDALSTEMFYSTNEMNDSQVTVGPKDFGDHQINIGNDVVYLGADDSRQANALNTDSEYFKVTAQYLFGEHVISAGYEREDLTIFNKFVQHSRGGEWDYNDDSTTNAAACSALTAAGRLADPTCGLSGIDKFELGRPDTIYYGSGGGTNNPDDAAANFSNVMNSLYLQDEYYLANADLSVVFGLRYDWFESSDRPNYNPTFTAANGGLRNDANIDGLSILMPRIGFSWEGLSNVSVRGGFGLYSGGNPNVWLSNAWSNDGLTNAQVRIRDFGDTQTALQGQPDSAVLVGAGRPGYDVPQSLFDQVAAVTPTSALNSGLVLIDPDYKQPSEWKFALGATWDTSMWDIVMNVDFLRSRMQDSAMFVDLSQSVVGTTSLGLPIYDFTNGTDNLMLTNSDKGATSDAFSVSFSKDFDNGLDVMVGYAFTNAEDISPMTSSVAVSNFENLATSDINNPDPATSNYNVPHRFTMRVSYGAELFAGLITRATLYGFAAEGQAQSYVMGGSGLEGDGRFGRHLLYVPTGPSDPNVRFDPSFDQTAFFNWVNREGLGSGIVPRNETNAEWSYRVDFRLDQELPTFIDGTSARLFLKVYNLGNLLNDDWGQLNDAQFFSVQIVNSSVDSTTGQYVFERFSDRSVTDVNANASLWSARVGLELMF